MVQMFAFHTVRELEAENANIDFATIVQIASSTLWVCELPLTAATASC